MVSLLAAVYRHMALRRQLPLRFCTCALPSLVKLNGRPELQLLSAQSGQKALQNSIMLGQRTAHVEVTAVLVITVLVEVESIETFLVVSQPVLRQKRKSLRLKFDYIMECV